MFIPGDEIHRDFEIIEEAEEDELDRKERERIALAVRLAVRGRGILDQLQVLR